MSGSGARSATASGWHLLAWVGIVLAVVYLVLLGGTWPGIYFTNLRVLSLVIAAVAIVGWAATSRRSTAWLPASVFLPAIGASVASLAVSTVFSDRPRVGVEYLGYAALLGALYLLLVRLFADEFFRRRLVMLCVLLFLGVSIVYLATVVLGWIEFWRILGRFAIPPLRPNFEGLTFGNPSAVLTMTALLAVPAAVVAGSRLWALAAIAGIVIAVAITSGSRAGWIALAGTTALGLAAGFALPAGRAALTRSVRRLRSSRLALSTLVLSTALAAIGIVLVTPALLTRLTFEGGEVRAGFAAIALRLFESSPLVGVGPGMWVVEHIRETTPAETLYYIPHAHNIELQAFAELGLVGVAAGIPLIAGILWLLRDGARDTDPARRAWAVYGALALTYFGLHQQLDFYANFPGFLFAAAVPLAYLDATRRSQPRWPPLTLSPRVSSVGAILLVAVSALLLWREAPATTHAQAATLADAGQWAEAHRLAAAALADDPDMTPYAMTAAVAAAHVGADSDALALFQRVASTDDLPEAWLDLAAIQARLGQTPETLASLNRALRLGLQDPAIAMAAGDLALRLGDADVAATAFEAALATAPSLAGDPWWRGDPTREQSFIRAVDAVLGSAPPATRLGLFLAVGEIEAAQATSDEFGLAADDIVGAWAGDPDAEAAVVGQCESRPTDPAALHWCVLVEQHLGRDEQAERFNSLATILAAHVGAMRISVGPGEPAIVGGAYQWGTYTYRRPTPVDLYVPGLLRVRFE